MIAAALLGETEIAATPCRDLIEFEQAIDDDTLFVIVAEEALRSADLTAMARRLADQPAWSDLPVIVLTQHGGGLERNPTAARLSEVLGNVTFLERPFHPTTFVSVARTALKGRQRQYEARALIARLHESELRLRTALLAGHLGSWELDLEHWELTTSATCKAAFGRGANEPFTYQQLLDCVFPDDRERMQRAIAATIETGADYTIDYRTLWPDGSLHWAEIRARLVRSPDGESPRLVGVSSDITERKTVEYDLKRLNETLEERVAERTAELERAHATVLAEISQRQRAEGLLRQAQKMDMIGQLTGGVAHDFNNLLMAVLGNLELLRKYAGDEPRMNRLIDGAMSGAQRGAALTQRLLAFARRQDLRVEPTSLIELVRGMDDLMERSAGAAIELVIELPDLVRPALVDGNQVELALLNLVINARDAMPDGGVLTIKVDEVESHGEGELKRGHYVRLSVSDTGHGMDATTLEKSIEPFFSTKELGKGTGLGLSMIHGLAVQLNGALRLASQPGHGTTAELWLPATEADGAG
jgi:PAS domain S-box-containing protein